MTDTPKNDKPLYNGPQSKFHDVFWRNLYARIGDKAISESDQVSVGRALSITLDQANACLDSITQKEISEKLMKPLNSNELNINSGVTNKYKADFLAAAIVRHLKERLS